MFIKEVVAISPQLTYTNEFLDGDVKVYKQEFLTAIEPSYLELIPANLLRRMGKAVRMGIGTGLPLMKKYPSIEGIIIGTANGGMEDCIRFLNQIVDYEEGVLTPTNFVQSTSNAIAGQLALMGQKTGYNSTHSNSSLAFDNALLDAQLVLESSNKQVDLLVGAVEEISNYNYNIDKINGLFKNEVISTSELIVSQSKGSLCGEGAVMLVVSNDSSGAIAEIVDQFQISFPEQQELHQLIIEFLNKNNLTQKDIDLLITGNSGDSRSDFWYSDLQQTLFPNTRNQTYKQFCGDYRTANAFGCYLAVKLFEGTYKIEGFDTPKNKTILLYNQFAGERHGFILMKNQQI